MMGGEVDVVCLGIPTSLQHIQSGRVRALTALSKQRLPSLPNVPTTKEAGFESLEMTTWYGILAAGRTPRDIVDRWNAEWIKISAMPDTIEKMQKVGFEPMKTSPEQFAEFIKVEIARWGKVIRDANLSVEEASSK